MNFIHYREVVRYLLPISSRHQLYKCIAVMKLTILLLALSLQVSAFSQSISLNYKNAPLREVLESIRKQSGYNFIVPSEALDKANPVTLTVNSSSIEEILHSVFAGQPFTYQISRKIIMIKEKVEEGNLYSTIKNQQRKNISGTVQDEKGRPIAGATVILKEQNNRVAITDNNGHFSFDNTPEKGTILIRMIGRETKEVSYKNDSTLSITLKDADMRMEEIQIIAYGKIQKKFTTSNIGSIKANDIAKQPVSNPLLALQGRVPGIFIEQTSGFSSANVEVVLQGRNSMRNGNVPFYVIDGVPYTSQDIASPVMGGIFPGTGGSTLNFINPGDIESVEFLKDADATAIYGSRAANGAILITTKRGKPGETKVELNIQNGWGKITRELKLLNTKEYLTIRKEALKNANASAAPSDYDINDIWDQEAFTDWQKKLIGGTAQYQNIQASVSGGAERTQFLIGTAYNRQSTVFPADFSNVKANMHFNIVHFSKNKRFQIGLTGNFLQGVNKLANNDLTSQAITLAPNAPKLYNLDGSLNFEPSHTNSDLYTFDNPVATLERKYKENTTNLISSAQLSYELVNGLVLKTDVGYNRLESDEISIQPSSSFRPDQRARIPRSANYSNKYIQSWIIEPQLSYSKDLLNSHIDALIGTTFQQTKNYLSAINGTGYSNDAQLVNPQAASNISIIGTLQSNYRYAAIFGRFNYRYKDKYILNLTARRDGSSRFGSENLFHSFYSAGAAWLFSDETFFKNVSKYISFGKLRVTYGTTGNDQIPDYQFLNLYDNYGVDIAYQNLVGLEPQGLQNPYLQWEETKKTNIGLDLGFLDNKINLNVNYFRNRSSNQLLLYALPIITGFNTVQRNLSATVENKGWEFLIDASPIKSKKFSWKTSVNLTIPENKLIRYNGLEKSAYAKFYIIGQPTNIIKTYSYAGVNTETGLYQFKNSKGETTSTPNSLTDQLSIVNINPKWYGGFTNDFNYKGFELSFLLQFVKQLGRNYRFGTYPGFTANYNQPSIVLSRWQSPNDETDVQKVSTNFREIRTPSLAARNSNASFSDASYMRLKNISLSYTLPSQWTKSHIANAKIYINGQNLLTITKYEGDPETKITGSLPPLRVYSLGLQLTF